MRLSDVLVGQIVAYAHPLTLMLGKPAARVTVIKVGAARVKVRVPRADQEDADAWVKPAHLYPLTRP